MIKYYHCCIAKLLEVVMVIVYEHLSAIPILYTLMCYFGVSNLFLLVAINLICSNINIK